MHRFAFLVHPLHWLGRGATGARSLNWRRVLQIPTPPAASEVGILCRVGFRDAEGLVIGVPLLPEDILSQQQLALDMMCQAVKIGQPLEMIGLGSVLAVVASRGAALQQETGVPVTTGNAATAWTALTVASAVHESGPIAVLGSGGPVGRAVAAMLREEGFTVEEDPDDCRPFRLLVGAHTTGGILPPEQLSAGATLVDVALPPTLAGPAPRGVRVLKGESIALPRGWRRDVWGHLFHIISPFGHQSTYTCLLEPLVAVLTGRREPFAQGRRLSLDAVREFGRAATAFGFYPEIKRVGRFSRRLGVVTPRARPPIVCEMPQEVMATESVGG